MLPSRPDVGAVLPTIITFSVQLKNAVGSHGAISLQQRHGLSVCRWKPITLARRWWMASPAKGIPSVSSLKTRIITATANIYILDESNRAEVYHHCEGRSKEELVRDVGSYSMSRDRFHLRLRALSTSTCRSCLIDCEVDGRTQVILSASGVAPIPGQDVTLPVLQQHTRRFGGEGVSRYPPDIPCWRCA